MKKFLAILLAAVMLLGLAACVAPDNDGGNGDGDKGGDAKVTAKVIELDLTEELYAFGVDKNQPELLTQVNAFIKKIKDNGTLESIMNKYFGGEGEPTLVTSAELDPSKDQLVVATNAEFEPFEYTKGDKYLGVDMEIAALLAQELGKELVISHMDFDAVCLSVGLGQCDIAMAGLTVSEEREEHVAFSESYYTASQRIIVPSNDTVFANCKTAADVETILKGLDKTTKIGVQNGTTGQLYSEGDADWGFDGFPVTTVGYKNGSLAVQDMLNGNISYVIIDAGPAKCITEKINALI
ncbi:MAG: transporter substrate-binding domain-containing protein [Clostridia bacterium]|nr:transporter substrate-binding domain-containing protein [Clostridia bacterium]